MRRPLLLTAAAVMAAAVPASAQPHAHTAANSYNFAVGSRIVPGYGASPAIWPLNYPGFWGNGFSMYGPPVPTNASIPGYFGGYDHHAVPGYGNTCPYGLWWGGSRSPSPRPTPNFAYEPVWPAQVGGPNALTYPFGTDPSGYRKPAPRPEPDWEPILPGMPVTPQPAVRYPGEMAPPPNGIGASELAPAPKPIRIELRVPSTSAEVYVDGRKTQQTGVERSFETPPLPADEIAVYELRATWKENGRPVSRTRLVSARPGERVRVDFTQLLTGDSPAR